MSKNWKAEYEAEVVLCNLARAESKRQDGEIERLRDKVAYYIQQARLHRSWCIGYMKTSNDLLTLYNAATKKAQP